MSTPRITQPPSLASEAADGGPAGASALRLAAIRAAAKTTRPRLTRVATAVVKRLMLGEEAALRSSASSGRAAANSAKDRLAAGGDPPSPGVKERGAPLLGGADAAPAPGGACSQLKLTARPDARWESVKPCC